MAENQIDVAKKREKEIILEIAKKIETGLGVRVAIIGREQIDDLFNILIKDNQYLEHFSEPELKQEIGTFISSLYAIPPKDTNDLNDRITKFGESLEREKEYTAIFAIEGVYRIPVGTEIGLVKIIEPDLSNPMFKDYFENVLQKRTKCELIDCVWGKIKFKSYKNQGVKEEFFEKIEFFLSIITFLLDHQLDPNALMGAIFSETGGITFIGGFEGFSQAVYQKRYEPILKRLSEISFKRKPTQVESKIFSALDIFWLSQLAKRKEIEFLMLISTLESLLLTESDRDYLGYKIAEKTAFLLGTTKENRIKIYKLMKKMYKTRSDLVHRGEKNIDEGQLNQLKYIVHNSLLKILELSSEYERMDAKDKPTGKDGIDDLFMNMKFEIPPSD
jgi:hypothetical protein